MVQIACGIRLCGGTVLTLLLGNYLDILFEMSFSNVDSSQQKAALNLLQNLAMVTGVPPLVRWLQRFRFDPQQPGADAEADAGGVAPSTSTSLVLGAGTLTFSWS